MSVVPIGLLQREIEKAPFIRWWGATLLEVGDGSASVALPFREELIRPGGVLHGSSYELVADVAMWVAIMTKVGIEPMAVTIEMKTSFFKGATTDILAKANILKLGKRVTFGEAEIFSNGELMAHSTLSYAMPRH